MNTLLALELRRLLAGDELLARGWISPNCTRNSVARSRSREVAASRVKGNSALHRADLSNLTVILACPAFQRC